MQIIEYDNRLIPDDYDPKTSEQYADCVMSIIRIAAMNNQAIYAIDGISWAIFKALSEISEGEDDLKHLIDAFSSNIKRLCDDGKK